MTATPITHHEHQVNCLQGARRAGGTMNQWHFVPTFRGIGDYPARLGGLCSGLPRGCCCVTCRHKADKLNISWEDFFFSGMTPETIKCRNIRSFCGRRLRGNASSGTENDCSHQNLVLSENISNEFLFRKKRVERQYGNLVQILLDAHHDNSNVFGVQGVQWTSDISCPPLGV